MKVSRHLAHAVVAVAVLASCGGSVAQPNVDALAGTYQVKGGGAALDVFQALSDEFRKQHPLVRFSFQDIGSRAGMILASSGEVDLATSSATPPPEVRAAVTVVPVGSSGTAVIVSSVNPVSALTKAQVRDIFSGAITDWSAVGGPSEKIIVVIREATSALRSNFDAYFFSAERAVYRSDAIVLNSGDDIARAVASQSTVVSMVTITASMLAESRVRGLAIDGVAPTKENIRAGRYPVVRPLFLVYNVKTLKPAIAAFLDFVRSPEGQRVIDSATTGT